MFKSSSNGSGQSGHVRVRCQGKVQGAESKEGEVGSTLADDGSLEQPSDREGESGDSIQGMKCRAPFEQVIYYCMLVVIQHDCVLNAKYFWMQQPTTHMCEQ